MAARRGLLVDGGARLILDHAPLSPGRRSPSPTATASTGPGLLELLVGELGGIVFDALERSGELHGHAPGRGQEVVDAREPRAAARQHDLADALRLGRRREVVEGALDLERQLAGHGLEGGHEIVPVRRRPRWPCLAASAFSTGDARAAGRWRPCSCCPPNGTSRAKTEAPPWTTLVFMTVAPMSMSATASSAGSGWFSSNWFWMAKASRSTTSASRPASSTAATYSSTLTFFIATRTTDIELADSPTTW